MNLYLIQRLDAVDYDEYDSVVVIAKSEEEALKIHPNYDLGSIGNYWTAFENPKVIFLGRAIDELEEKLGSKVVIASFNAG